MKETSFCNKWKQLYKTTIKHNTPQLWSPVLMDTSTNNPTGKAQGTLRKKGQKDYKRLRIRFTIRLCLLEISEAILTNYPQHDCSSMSWARVTRRMANCMGNNI